MYQQRTIGSPVLTALWAHTNPATPHAIHSNGFNDSSKHIANFSNHIADRNYIPIPTFRWSNPERVARVTARSVARVCGPRIEGVPSIIPR